MRKLTTYILIGVLPSLIAVPVTTVVVGQSPVAFPAQFWLMIASAAAITMIVAGRHSLGIGIVTGVTLASTAVIYCSRGDVDKPVLLWVFCCIILVICLRRLPYVALLMVVVTTATCFLQMGWIVASIVLAIGLAVLGVDRLVLPAQEFAANFYASLSGHIVGIAWFFAIYVTWAIAFALTCRCVDVMVPGQHLKCGWVPNGEPTSFLDYLQVGVMSMSANPIDVHPYSRLGAGLLSLQAIVRLLLLVILLNKFMQASVALKGQKQSA
jgi:hypothetical protein